MAHTRRPRRRSPWSRRLGGLILIAAVAGFIGWWGAQGQSQQLRDVRQYVGTLIQTAPRQGDTRRVFPNLPGLDDAMSMLREAMEADPDNVDIMVRPGDRERDGDASHTAVINLGGEPRLGLRIRHGGKSAAGRSSGGAEAAAAARGSLNVEVIGYWLP